MTVCFYGIYVAQDDCFMGFMWLKMTVCFYGIYVAQDDSLFFGIYVAQDDSLFLWYLCG
jgi:hypothetical protein